MNVIKKYVVFSMYDNTSRVCYEIFITVLDHCLSCLSFVWFCKHTDMLHDYVHNNKYYVHTRLNLY